MATQAPSQPETKKHEAMEELVNNLPAGVKEHPYLHHGLPLLVPACDEQIEKLVQPDLDPLTASEEPIFKTRVYGELAEHDYLGNSILLQDPSDKDHNIQAAKLKLKLQNGLELTYGQINWLAGDFYGTNTPISDGKDQAERVQLFKNAYAFLAERASAKDEAERILEEGRIEIQEVSQAISEHKDPSTVYPAIEKLAPWKDWVDLTNNRPNGMGYLGLAQNNFDHFGEDAQKAYDAGHAYAMEVAASGDLNKAYAINAFADHFLEDRFSAGHLRTPRRFCHLNLTAGFAVLDVGSLCAKFMHDEDSAIGLNVTNSKGEGWKCYGDKRMLDVEDGENKQRCILAIRQSTREVEDAFNNGKVPDEVGLVWTIAPTLESARDQSKQELSPLFTPDGKVRDDVKNRRDTSHSAMGFLWIGNWAGWFTDIAVKCQLSGRWNSPISM